MTGGGGATVVAPGTVLLHIGPQKTGTTAVQDAFHRARRPLHEQGVRYAGPNRQSKQAARALQSGLELAATGHARRLVREVRGSVAERIVVSAEAFADTDAGQIRRIVEVLGGARVHVVVTLRPLARILPSQWQQFVQGGLAEPFDDFLKRALNAARAASDEPAAARLIRRFWHRHRHDHLIARWAEVVGRERMSAIVIDDRDRNSAVRAFEQLLGVRQNTLVVAEDTSNRSLSLAEVDLLRELNGQFAAATAGDGSRRNEIQSFGIAEHLKARPLEDSAARIAIPAWAVEEIATISREIVAGIRDTGVDVLGTLDALSAQETGSQTTTQTSRSEWADIAATAALGVLVSGGFARSARPANAGASFAWRDEVGTVAARSLPRLASISNQRISSVIAGRLWSMAHRSRTQSRDAIRQMATPAPVHSAAVEEQ